MVDPIMIPCEGSGYPGHDFGATLMCTMCGSHWAPDLAGLVPDHDRRDILAMVARGDFDA